VNPSEEPFRVREIWPPGTVIKGDFSIQRKLGGGGFGTVYLAQHRFLNTTHVIKRLHEHYASNPEYVRKFVTEARAVSRLNECPNVVKVQHMTQSEDGHLILVMEHIAGGDLAGLMESRQLSVAEVIEYARQISTGLAAAHAAGLVHRDIKPHNVMISHNSTGKPVLKLIDFGIVADQLNQQQTSVMRGGSIGYAAPEQWAKAGKELDGRTDLYSLGASMYRMLCGRMPYESDDVYGWIEQARNGPPAAPSLLRKDVPPALSDLILELLALRPEGRPADAATVIRRLDAIEINPAKSYKPTVEEAPAKTILRDTKPSSAPERPPERAQTRPEPPPSYAPPPPPPAPKWRIWSGIGVVATVVSAGAWFAIGNKEQPVQPVTPDPVIQKPVTTKEAEPPKTKREAEKSLPEPIEKQKQSTPPEVKTPVISKEADPPQSKPESKVSRPEPASSQQSTPPEEKTPKPEPVIDHAALGDTALNAGDLRSALAHYKALGDATRLAKLQLAVESDTDERVAGMLDKGQYAEALRLVDGWSASFPGSRRLQALHTKIVYARDHQ
jgi:serine/threonine-protein kinase